MSDKKIIDLESGWAEMEAGIEKLEAILEGDESCKIDCELWINLYTTVYNMCTQKAPHDYSQQLYDRYKHSFNEYIEEAVLPKLREKTGEFMLKELRHRWGNHKVMVRWLSRIFNYLDRYYITRHSLASLHDVGLVCFRDLIFDELRKPVKDAVLHMINMEREGEQIDRALVKGVLEIFVDIGMGGLDVYERDFEFFLLEDTAIYYKRKAASWINENSCPEYMEKSEQCLNRERERVEHYLDKRSESKILREAEQELLAVYEQQLLEKEQSGCAALLRDDKTEDLSRMFRLFSRIPKGLVPMSEMFKKHVQNEGLAIVKAAEEAAQERGKRDRDSSTEHLFVRRSLELHDKYLQYVSGCFNNNAQFHKALKEAFELFCNKGVHGSNSAELLATFCDNLLKKGGSEKLSDEAIESTLENVVRLLAYINDKDMFSEFYRKRLARRLLFDKSANDEHERSILAKLKQQCGAQFTSRMEGMVNDIALARDQQSAFEEWLRARPEKDKPGLDLQVNVLTTGFWPTYKQADLVLPAEMVKCVEIFKEYYEEKTKHRKLAWIYSLGTCHLKGKFGSRWMELMISTYQAAVLLLFNHSKSLTYEEIKSQLNLPDEDIVRSLHSLACAKYQILLKEPPGKTVAKTDTFIFNDSFTDRLKRIKVPLPPVDEKKKVVEDVDKDRRHAVDAAIVRIMKSRKTLQHQQLTVECMQQLNRMFKPDFRLIKKRIEDLVQREYLERDKDNPQIFRYLA
mmetsp:Transcript_133/g.406  ORF Transcript_133/g.406 Transcript_133/m.406 type:complete len:742 (+) Transcript_133:275-2500(+)